jgi:hypothetical protein
MTPGAHGAARLRVQRLDCIRNRYVIGDATIRVDRDVAPTLLVETIRALRSA